MTTFLELANRFRTHTFSKPADEPHTLWHKDDSSVGNRYRRWQNIAAKRSAEEGDNVISMEKVYEYVKALGAGGFGMVFKYKSVKNAPKSKFGDSGIPIGITLNDED